MVACRSIFLCQPSSSRRGLSRPIFILSRLFWSGQGSSTGTKQSSGFWFWSVSSLIFASCLRPGRSTIRTTHLVVILPSQLGGSLLREARDYLVFSVRRSRISFSLRFAAAALRFWSSARFPLGWSRPRRVWRHASQNLVHSRARSVGVQPSLLISEFMTATVFWFCLSCLVLEPPDQRLELS
jgi:hypothetical protein